jgi:predicted amidophosphoribosyltransferase
LRRERKKDIIERKYWLERIDAVENKNNKRICPNCGRKMKQQFIGLKHCKCGMSWKKDIGYFERTEDMVFALERRNFGKKWKLVPVIKYK